MLRPHRGREHWQARPRHLPRSDPNLLVLPRGDRGGDRQALAAGSSIVPSTHEGISARDLHYGYAGDFGGAVHLLVPAIEALVRLHLANAGERTSTISAEGGENEIGLPALTENERVVDIFGEDVAFELRALLCGDRKSVV